MKLSQLQDQIEEILEVNGDCEAVGLMEGASLELCVTGAEFAAKGEAEPARAVMALTLD